MVYKLGNTRDMELLPNMSDSIWQVIYDAVSILSEIYGADRDVDNNDGGYVLYMEPGSTVRELDEYFDYTERQVEYVTLYKELALISALYILNNEYTVTIIMSVKDAPADYLAEMEGDKNRDYRERNHQM